ncbi:MAG: sulfurtransferase TusA family protein [Candidatus Diapherotrites archaeon]|nr:sulfurtransferase TusA family protein [Candidatus Diapherotrites archaeon]
MRIDVTKEKCPKPLIETRNALRKLKPGETLEVIGFDPPSKGEIEMAAKAAGYNCEVHEDEQGIWTIKIWKDQYEH